jgi:hypothetical protein
MCVPACVRMPTLYICPLSRSGRPEPGHLLPRVRGGAGGRPGAGLGPRTCGEREKCPWPVPRLARTFSRGKCVTARTNGDAGGAGLGRSGRPVAASGVVNLKGCRRSAAALYQSLSPRPPAPPPPPPRNKCDMELHRARVLPPQSRRRRSLSEAHRRLPSPTRRQKRTLSPPQCEQRIIATSSVPAAAMPQAVPSSPGKLDSEPQICHDCDAIVAMLPFKSCRNHSRFRAIRARSGPRNMLQ